MEIDVVSDKANLYLDRREIKIKIIHENEATPKRIDVFKSAVDKFSLDPENTVLIKLETRRGTNISFALIYYYPEGIDWPTIEPIKRKKVISIGEEKSEEKG